MDPALDALFQADQPAPASSTSSATDPALDSLLKADQPIQVTQEQSMGLAKNPLAISDLNEDSTIGMKPQVEGVPKGLNATALGLAQSGVTGLARTGNGIERGVNWAEGLVGVDPSFTDTQSNQNAIQQLEANNYANNPNGHLGHFLGGAIPYALTAGVTGGVGLAGVAADAISGYLGGALTSNIGEANTQGLEAAGTMAGAGYLGRKIFTNTPEVAQSISDQGGTATQVAGGPGAQAIQNYLAKTPGFMGGMEGDVREQAEKVFADVNNLAPNVPIKGIATNFKNDVSNQIETLQSAKNTAYDTAHTIASEAGTTIPLTQTKQFLENETSKASQSLASDTDSPRAKLLNLLQTKISGLTDATTDPLTVRATQQDLNELSKNTDPGVRQLAARTQGAIAEDLASSSAGDVYKGANQLNADYSSLRDNKPLQSFLEGPNAGKISTLKSALSGMTDTDISKLGLQQSTIDQIKALNIKGLTSNSVTRGSQQLNPPMLNKRINQLLNSGGHGASESDLDVLQQKADLIRNAKLAPVKKPTFEPKADLTHLAGLLGIPGKATLSTANRYGGPVANYIIHNPNLTGSALRALLYGAQQYNQSATYSGQK